MRACCWVGMHVYGGDLGLFCVHAVGSLIIESLHSYCWVVMHGTKMFACLYCLCTIVWGLMSILVGCFARLFVGLRAYCSAVLHVYWGKGVMCILLVT